MIFTNRFCRDDEGNPTSIHLSLCSDSGEKKSAEFMAEVYDSLAADEWIEDNREALMKDFQVMQNIRGPIACMLSYESAALCIFGSISDTIIAFAKKLADSSGFPVIIQEYIHAPG
jgi:hypothetical protein